MAHRKKGPSRCNYCGGRITGMPHSCKFCGERHCDKHILPEDHNCSGLKRNSLSKTKHKKTTAINYRHRKDFKEVKSVNNNSDMGKNKMDFNGTVSQAIDIAKWVIICTIGVLISNFAIGKLSIANNLLITLLTAIIISIVVELVRSHDHKYSFRMDWFIFYFLVYSNVVWIVNELILKNKASPGGFFTSLIIGFFLASAIIILKKIRLKSSSRPWATLILILILVVGNLGYLSSLTGSFTDIISDSPQNTSGLSEDKLLCPTMIYTGETLLTKEKFDSLSGMQLSTQALINLDVWTIENNVGSCYVGKYKNQFPNWIYCDDLIVSRWETGSSGTINYRWYTAVSSEWKPAGVESTNSYVLNGFNCENGQKVTVEKGVTNYYVYDSKDGKQIRIKY
ncbi:MAG: hypothetical protein KKF50_05550 [Nanoarchaeota archaeon]|nr:hypothetical protein [Nanoarchaeota archaeon]